MSKPNIDEIKSKIKNNEALTDDEYNELLRQAEIQERPERAKQRLKNYEERQLIKYSFLVGVVAGAGIMLGLQRLWELLQ
jgi:hypothetical protein